MMKTSNAFDARARGMGMTTLLALLVAAAAVAGGGWWAWQKQFLSEPAKARVYEPVVRRTLDVTLTTTGELQAIENTDIVCPVRGQNTIVEIVPEGTSVKEGDVLCRLDSSQWQTRVEEATIGVRGAEGDVTWAKEQLALQESESAGKLQEAEVALRLAKLSWEEFDKGTRPAEQAKSQRALEMSKIARDKAEDDYNRVRALLTRGFTTAAEVKEKQRLFLQAEGAYSEAETEYELLNQYKHAKQEAELTNKLEQAQAALDRAETEAASNLNQKKSDLLAKEQKLSVFQRQLENSQKDLDACTILAPSDGMVIYATSVQQYYMSDGPLQVGTQIYEGRLLIRLPNLNGMKAVASVGEHRINEVRIDAQSPLVADVKIPGYRELVRGTVTKKGIMPAQSNFYSESKQYPVDIELLDFPPEVKPGTSCEATILIDSLPDVLVAPLNCVWRDGDEAWVFVQDPAAEGGLAARPITLGAMSETHCEIIDGVAEGDRLLGLVAGEGAKLLSDLGEGGV